jgi:hypothetical protein
VYDVDGSLSGTDKPTYITPYYNHLDLAIAENRCTHESGDNYDNSVICDDAVLRGMHFGSL